ncbi:hypothetical protein TOPH_08408 [Tolypocladium ophioglossoides CBS 100239]|uniref:DUF3669 domain-containing protein n=1 Tax=Tolypocladium ophioglossoides (strain CBS 100239) TaxID=1163406 RepID=A0A0L0MYS9_TOLOC|nr:hypothetical protein TOPH_08408 [Tolypocladium ophioglossoides CBS 100239]
MFPAYAFAKARALVSLLAKCFLWQPLQGMEGAKLTPTAEAQQQEQQPCLPSRGLQASRASQAADEERPQQQQPSLLAERPSLLSQQWPASAASQTDAEEQQRPQQPSLPSQVLQASEAAQAAGAEKQRREEARDHRFRFQSHCRCSPKHLNSEAFLLVPTDSGASLSATHFVCPQADHVEMAAARINNVPLAEQWAIQLRLEGTRLRHLRKRLKQLDITRAYALEPLVDTARAQVYTTTVGTKTHVIKLTGSATALLNEYDVQNEVFRAMHHLWRLSRGARPTGMPPSERRPVVPKATYLVSSKADETGKLGLVMDYMLPLRDPYRSFLARKYLHPDALASIMAQPGWETLTLLLHMGETRPEFDELSIRVRDRPVYLDPIFAELGPKGVRNRASSMGATLAVLHWGCQLDAKGVKFQVGLTSKSHFAVWLYDFGDCANFDPAAEDLATRLAEVASPSPFWPRPASAHGFGREDEVPEYITVAWRAFAKTYLGTSMAVAQFLGPSGWMPQLPRKNGGRLVVFTEFIQAFKKSWRLASAGTRAPPARRVGGPQIEGHQHQASADARRRRTGGCGRGKSSM